MQELDELGREIETIKWIARAQQKEKPASVAAEKRVEYRAASAAK